MKYDPDAMLGVAAMDPCYSCTEHEAVLSALADRVCDSEPRRLSWARRAFQAVRNALRACVGKGDEG